MHLHERCVNMHCTETNPASCKTEFATGKKIKQSEKIIPIVKLRYLLTHEDWKTTSPGRNKRSCHFHKTNATTWRCNDLNRPTGRKTTLGSGQLVLRSRQTPSQSAQCSGNLNGTWLSETFVLLDIPELKLTLLVITSRNFSVKVWPEKWTETIGKTLFMMNYSKLLVLLPTELNWSELLNLLMTQYKYPQSKCMQKADEPLQQHSIHDDFEHHQHQTA